MARILINAVSAKSGGAATYVRNLAQSLGSSPHRYVLVIPETLDLPETSLGTNTDIRRSPIAYSGALSRFIWDQLNLRCLARRENIDLLVSSSDFGMLAPPCKQILMVRNSLFFSALFEERYLPRKRLSYRLGYRLRRMLSILSAKSSNLVVTSSHSMLKQLSRFLQFPEDRLVVNPFGVPEEKFRPRPPRGSDTTASREFRVLFVSEYADYKNLATLLRATRILARSFCGPFSVTATMKPSDFPDEDITTRSIDRELASQPDIRRHVRLTGPVPYSKVQDLYQESDVFVFPSVVESFGHPLVEAMASGVPVVAADTASNREICGDAAVYFSSFDENALSDRILKLAEDEAQRQLLSELGCARAKSCFAWADHFRRLEAQITQLVE